MGRRWKVDDRERMERMRLDGKEEEGG